MISAQNGHLEVVKTLLEAEGRELLMLTTDNGTSCLWISASNGHLEVVKALLEAGGRELAMLTTGNRTICLLISAQNGHLEVTNTLLEAGGSELLILTNDCGVSCLSIARRTNSWMVCRVLETACQNAGLSSDGWMMPFNCSCGNKKHEISNLKCG